MVAGKINSVPSDARATTRNKWKAALLRQLASALSLKNRDRETLMSYAEELERDDSEAQERQAGGAAAALAKSRSHFLVFDGLPARLGEMGSATTAR